MHASRFDDSTILPGTRHASRWLIAVSLIVTVGFSGICGAILLKMRAGDWDKAKQASENLVATIEADVARNIELYDVSLQATVDALKLPGIYQISRELRHLILFGRSSAAKDIGSI